MSGMFRRRSDQIREHPKIQTLTARAKFKSRSWQPAGKNGKDPFIGYSHGYATHDGHCYWLRRCILESTRTTSATGDPSLNRCVDTGSSTSRLPISNEDTDGSIHASRSRALHPWLQKDRSPRRILSQEPWSASHTTQTKTQEPDDS